MLQYPGQALNCKREGGGAGDRGTQLQFSENICSEEDLRSRIFGTLFCCKLSCLPASPKIFERLKNGIIAPFQWIFTPKRSPRIFGSLFQAEIFEKVSFDPFNFRITRLSARKSEQMKNFQGIKNAYIYRLTKIHLTMLWF